MTNLVIHKQRWHTLERYIISCEEGVITLELYNEPQGLDSVQAYICNFWVKEKHRRQSTGTRLMQHAEDIARNKGHKAVFLEHDWRDTAEYVREWYERTGYTEIGFNNEGVTLMKKTL